MSAFLSKRGSRLEEQVVELCQVSAVAWATTAVGVVGVSPSPPAQYLNMAYVAAKLLQLLHAAASVRSQRMECIVISTA